MPRSRYRLEPSTPLRQTGHPPIFGYLDAIGSWASGWSWVAGWLSTGPSTPLRLRIGGVEGSGESISYSRPDLDAISGAVGILGVVAIDLAATTFIVPEVEVELLGHWYRWTERRELALRPDASTWLGESLPGLGPPIRHAVAGFLAGQPRRDGGLRRLLERDRLLQRNRLALDHLLDGDRHATELAEPAFVQPSRPFGFSFECCLLLDPESLLVVGWSFDPNREAESAWIVLAGGRRREIDFARALVPRDDVQAIYAAHFGDRASCHRQIVSLVALAPGEVDRLRGLEVRRRDGTVFTCPLPAIERDPFVARELLHRLVAASWLPEAVLASVVEPAHHAVQLRCRRRPSHEVVRAGAPPDRPRGSLLLLLSRDPHHLPDQLLLLAGDPTMEGVDLVAVAAASLVPADLVHELDELVGLYGLSFRLVLAEGPAELSTAANLGAEIATGEVLVFLDRLASPTRAGWLDALFEAALAPGAGVAGPRLLSDPGTVAAAGLRLERSLSGRLESRPIGAGCASAQLHPEPAHGFDLPGLTVSRALFERLGGFRDLDLGPRLEALDLSVRAGGARRPARCVDRSDLVLLDPTPPAEPASRRRYDWWRATRLWSAEGLLP